MKKLPLWAYNEDDQRYEVFPYELFEDFKDGEKGFAFPILANNPKNIAILKLRVLALYPRHFKLDEEGQRYVFLYNVKQEPPSGPTTQLEYALDTNRRLNRRCSELQIILTAAQSEVRKMHEATQSSEYWRIRAKEYHAAMMEQNGKGVVVSLYATLITVCFIATLGFRAIGWIH